MENNEKPVENIYNEIKALSNDYDSGSTAIAIKAVEILFKAMTYKEIISKYRRVAEVAAFLVSAKPAMAALKNLVNYSLDRINNRGNLSYAQLKKNIINKANESGRLCLENITHIVEKEGSDVFITCSYSSTVIKFFDYWKARGNKFRVVAIESKWKERDFSKYLCKKCKESDIECSIAGINAMDDYIKDGACSIIGADSIIPGEGVINGIPSLRLAKKTHGKIPFYVLGESFKIIDGMNIDEGFDFVPLNYISEIITDDLFYKDSLS